MLVITKKYGINFTGATVATQKLIEQWSSYFDEIQVLTLEIGQYKEVSNVEVLECKNVFQLVKKMKFFKENKYQGYSDDHLGFLLGISGIPYIHTYHGNWPDAMWINLSFFVKSFVFIPLYMMSIGYAKKVINVSFYMNRFTKKYNKNSIVIRNGIKTGKQDRALEISQVEGSIKLVMIGGVDKRKYGLCNKLFEIMSEKNSLIHIDIFGEIHDQKLFSELNKYQFVNFKGFTNDIDINEYHFLLSTASIENLPISIVEALYSKIPVISFNTGGINEVIIDLKNGVLVPNKNIVMMSNVLQLSFLKNLHFDFYLSDLNVEQFNWQTSGQLYIEQFNLMEEI